MPKRFGTAGPRAIYPQAAISPSLAACDPLAQLLFDRMLTQADDQGRIVADPKVVKALCMPMIGQASARAVERWIGQLSDNRMLTVYEADGQQLAQFVNWWDHQAGMKKSYPSRYPAPAGWTDRVRGVGADDDDGAGPSGGKSSPAGGKSSPPGGNVPPKSPENPPTARAPSAAAEPNPAEPNPAAAETPAAAIMTNGTTDDDDHLDAWYRLTASWPSKKSIPWLNQLAADHGSASLSAALAAEFLADPERGTLIGRTRDRLEREAHSAGKQRKEADRQAAERERQRIEEMPPEQRKANMQRLREMLVESGLMSSEVEP